MEVHTYQHNITNNINKIISWKRENLTFILPSIGFGTKKLMLNLVAFPSFKYNNLNIDGLAYIFLTYKLN